MEIFACIFGREDFKKKIDSFLSFLSTCREIGCASFFYCSKQ